MHCGYCGKQLENANALICPECGGRVKNDNNFCTYCGEVREDKTKANCKFCNHEFENKVKKQEEKGEGKVKGLILSIIMFCIFIASIITLYENMTATSGYISSKTGLYVTAVQLHQEAPLQIIVIFVTGFLFIKVFVSWIKKLKKK